LLYIDLILIKRNAILGIAGLLIGYRRSNRPGVDGKLIKVFFIRWPETGQPRERRQNIENQFLIGEWWLSLKEDL
jgi:hypothetical protein